MGYFLNKLAEEIDSKSKPKDTTKRDAALAGAGLVGAGYHLGSHHPIKALANGSLEIGKNVHIPNLPAGTSRSDFVKDLYRKAGRANAGLGLASAGLAAYGAKKLYDRYKNSGNA